MLVKYIVSEFLSAKGSFSSIDLVHAAFDILANLCIWASCIDQCLDRFSRDMAYMQPYFEKYLYLG